MDDFRDERGRLKPGAPPLFKGKQSQSDQPADTPPFDGDFDDAIIFIAETYSGKSRALVGLLAVAEDLRRGKPTEYASFLRQAYINRKTKQDINTGGGPGIIVMVNGVPSSTFVDSNLQPFPAEVAKAEWEKRHAGITLTTDEPPPTPTPQPVPVSPRDDEDYDEPSYTLDEVKRMTKEQFDAALAAGEIVVVDETNE